MTYLFILKSISDIKKWLIWYNFDCRI